MWKIITLLLLSAVLASAKNCWDNHQMVLWEEEHGRITDHDGDAPYDSGSHYCTWLIKDVTESGRRITLKFNKFDMVNRTGSGRHDFLDIRDGPNSNSPEIAWFTGSDKPPVITSTGGAIFLTFYTWDIEGPTALGFELEYSISLCKNDCVGERNGYCWEGECNCNPGFVGGDCSQSMCVNDCGAPHGTCKDTKCECEDGYYGGDCMYPYCEEGTVINSVKGNFTDHHEEFSGKKTYLHNAKCTWNFQPPDDSYSHVRLIFTKFETEELFDYVVIYDGQDPSAPVIANLSGVHNKDLQFSSTGPHMYITYITDVGLSFGGFDASWEFVEKKSTAGISTGFMVVLFILALFIGAGVGVGGLLVLQRYHAQKSQEHYTRLPMDDGF